MFLCERVCVSVLFVWSCVSLRPNGVAQPRDIFRNIRTHLSQWENVGRRGLWVKSREDVGLRRLWVKSREDVGLRGLWLISRKVQG